MSNGLQGITTTASKYKAFRSRILPAYEKRVLPLIEVPELHSQGVKPA
ncbi:hypothetical protein QUA20_14215 [Microcoleus sp. Pol7_A1]